MGINFVSVPPSTNLPQLSTADGLYGLPSVINWPFAGYTWHTERWVEYHLTREAAKNALLRCRMWIASYDPKRINIRRAPRIEEEGNYHASRREFRVYGRLDVRDT